MENRLRFKENNIHLLPKGTERQKIYQVSITKNRLGFSYSYILNNDPDKGTEKDL